MTNFSRHLIHKHNDEEAVKLILKERKGSIARKQKIDILRKDGNFEKYQVNEVKQKHRI